MATTPSSICSRGAQRARDVDLMFEWVSLSPCNRELPVDSQERCCEHGLHPSVFNRSVLLMLLRHGAAPLRYVSAYKSPCEIPSGNKPSTEAQSMCMHGNVDSKACLMASKPELIGCGLSMFKLLFMVCAALLLHAATRGKMAAANIAPLYRSRRTSFSDVIAYPACSAPWMSGTDIRSTMRDLNLFASMHLPIISCRWASLNRSMR